MADVILNSRPKVGEVVAGHFITQVSGKKVWGIPVPFTPSPADLADWIDWDSKKASEKKVFKFIPGRRFAVISK